MSFNSKLMNGDKAVASTTLNGTAADAVKAGPTLPMLNVEPGTLSATVMVEAETNTITLSAVWEVSNDDSTYYRWTPANNAAIVVLATGTAGDDAAVTRVIEAPSAVYGWRYCRCSILVGVANALAADLYSLSYNYVRKDLL